MDILEYILNLNWQTIIGMFAICWYFTYDIKATLVKLDADVRVQGKRTDQLYQMFLTEVKVQDQRIDRLYQMFVDLLKEKSK